MISVLLSLTEVLKLAVIFIFVFIVIKMYLSHKEKMAKIKMGDSGLSKGSGTGYEYRNDDYNKN